MKKMICIAAALMMVSVFAASSFAANKVQMTLTSPTIYKAGCEKIGSTTYAFDAGSVVGNGDWWYMDLPEGITLCKSYNYIIAAAGAAAPNVTLSGKAPFAYENVVFNNTAGLTGAIATTATGPITLSGIVPAASTIVGNMAFLVQGTSGSRRITIYCLNNVGVSGIAGTNVANWTVANNTLLQFKLFDGKSWSLTDGTLTANDSRILLDNDGDMTYGEIGANATKGNEVIGGVNTLDATVGVPYVENTLCSNNTSLSGQYIYTSYASKNDEYTFSGDSQIAHTASSGAIALAQCHKNGTLKGDKALTTGQAAAACSFNYETAAAGNFCDSTFENRMIIKATSAFGDLGDKYTVSAEITSPADGVYFSGPATVTRYAAANDACKATGATVTPVTFIPYEGSTIVAAYAPTTCTINAGNRVNKIVQNGTASTIDLDSYNQLYIDFAPFAYGNTMVVAGEEVTVKVSLDRYPCGTIYSGTRTIGTFVTSCTTTTSTTVYFPWFPGSASATSGWWGGYVITNIGATAGTAALTYFDEKGNTATYTTPAVAAGAQFNGSTVKSSDLTPGADFDATLNYSIRAVCAFSARGFAFTGNGKEGVGYTTRP